MPASRSHRHLTRRATAACFAATMAAAGLLGSGSGLAAPANASADTTTSSVGTTGPSNLHWTKCPIKGAPATLQCATVPVPINWSKPNGAKTYIVVDRLKAKDPSNSEGDLLINPGGPGGAGTIFPYEESLGAAAYPASVAEHWNLIGFDPRGIGASAPLKASAKLFNQRENLFPQTKQEFDALVAHNHALSESLAKDSGPLASHVDTESVARDMDAIRAALGDSKLNYVGLSYGTQIGAEYADLFPSRVGRFLLDANFDPDTTQAEEVRVEGAAYSGELKRWGAWASSTKSSVLHGQNALKTFTTLAARADEHPIPAPGCKAGDCRSTVDGQEIRTDAQAFLAETFTSAAGPGWPGLAKAVLAAEHGNATALSPRLATSNASPAISASGLAVECLDEPSSANWKKLHALGEADRHANPLTGGLSQSYEIAMECAGWALPAQDPRFPIDNPHTAPILMVNATHDPETSLVWATGLHSHLPDSVLLIRDGDGHGSWLVPGKTQAAEARYLVNGTLPKPATALDS
jgi:pimeloyl-ACP methyl ester carboxylesterase